MRKKSLELALRVPHALQVAQYRREQTEVREVAERFARGEPLSHHDRIVITAVMREYVRIREPPPRPRGAKSKLNLLQVEAAYRYLVKTGERPAKAVGRIADKFGVSDAAVRAALRQGTFSAE